VQFTADSSSDDSDSEEESEDEKPKDKKRKADDEEEAEEEEDDFKSRNKFQKTDAGKQDTTANPPSNTLFVGEFFSPFPLLTYHIYFFL
jgi:chromatin remodeling complex protein RSC6